MIIGGRLRAARALASLDQRRMVGLAGLSVRTIQRMAASHGVVRGSVDSLTNLIRPLEAAGVDFIAEGVAGAGGVRGGRRRDVAAKAVPVDKRGRHSRKGRA